MSKENSAKYRKGFTLVEVVIASALVLSAVLALLGIHSLYLRTAFSNANAVKAAFLIEEGIEAVRFMRDASWDANIAPLSLSTEYGIVFNGTGWQTSTQTYVENFSRTASFSAVSRDANGDIVASGGSVDPRTLLLRVSVSWPNTNGTTTKSISTYITDIYEN